MTEVTTPITLWKNFAADSLPLNISVVKDSNGVRELYYSAACASGGIIRAFAKYYYHKGQSVNEQAATNPVIIFAGEAGKTTDYSDIAVFFEAGFNIFCADYSGRSDASRYTLYPESRGFSNFADNSEIYEASEGAQNSCWYDWTTVMRRATSCAAIQPESADKTAFVGVREGAHLSWIMAATEPRLAAAAAIFQPLQRQGGGEVEFSDARAEYAAVLAPSAYAQYIACPFIFATATNDDNGALERFSELIPRIQAAQASLTVAPRLTGQLFAENYSTLTQFLQQHLKDGAPLSARPVLEARVSEGRLYYNLTIDAAQDVESVTIYGASGIRPENRDWTQLKTDRSGENEFIARADLSCAHHFHAFANVRYKSGAVISSPVNSRDLVRLGLPETECVKTRLLYDGETDDCFFCSCGGALNPGVLTASGPLGISGATVETGALVTYRIGRHKYSGESGARLQLTFYAKEARGLTVAVVEKKERRERRFSAPANVPGAEFWQKLTFGCNDFKTADGAILPDWDNVTALAIEDAAGLIIAKILWI